MIPFAGRLDRYLARTVVGSYVAGFVFLAGMFVSIDMLVQLGSYLEGAAERELGFAGLLVDLGRYYLLFLPVVFVMVGPFVSVIAGMFAVSSHMAANELAPMLFTGRSMLRVLGPALGMGAVSALLMVLCWEFVMPRVTEPLSAARSALQGRDSDELRGLIVKLRDGVDQTLYVRRYDHAKGRMIGINLLDRSDPAAGLVIVSATEGVWDVGVGDWILVDGARRTESRSVPQPTLAVRGVEPDLLWRLGKEGRETLQLSYSELLDLQALRPGRKDFQLAFHNHITFPLANLVLLLLALPFAVHFERGGRTERVVYAVLICGAYLVVDLICQSLGRSTLHPLLAAWLPTIVFGSLGVVFFAGMRS